MILLSALLLAAEVGSEAALPVPISLGVAGISFASLVAILGWLIRSIYSGKWVPGVQVEARFTEKQRAYDDMVVVKDTQHGNDVVLLQEYRDTIGALQESRTLLEELLKKSIDANKLTDYFYATFMPKRDSAGLVGYNAVKEPDHD